MFMSLAYKENHKNFNLAHNLTLTLTTKIVLKKLTYVEKSFNFVLIDQSLKYLINQLLIYF